MRLWFLCSDTWSVGLLAWSGKLIRPRKGAPWRDDSPNASRTLSPRAPTTASHAGNPLPPHPTSGREEFRTRRQPPESLHPRSCTPSRAGNDIARARKQIQARSPGPPPGSHEGDSRSVPQPCWRSAAPKPDSESPVRSQRDLGAPLHSRYSPGRHPGTWECHLPPYCRLSP